MDSLSIDIFVPTINRPEFLIRAIKFYRREKFKGRIVIGDSSVPEQAERITKFIETVDDLEISYGHYPEKEFCHDGAVMSAMLEKSKSDFAVFSGDDDFLVPSSLYKAADALKSEPEFSAVIGDRLEITLDSDGAYGNIKKIKQTPTRSITDNSGASRWKTYLLYSNCLLYAVHRCADWQCLFQKCDQIPNRKIGAELLPCSISAISGKIKKIPSLLTVCHSVHANAFSPSHPGEITSHKADDTLRVSTRIFKERILEKLVAVDSMSSDDASAKVDEIFNLYLSRMKKWMFRNKVVPFYKELSGLKHRLSKCNPEDQSAINEYSHDNALSSIIAILGLAE